MGTIDTDDNTAWPDIADDPAGYAAANRRWRFWQTPPQEMLATHGAFNVIHAVPGYAFECTDAGYVALRTLGEAGESPVCGTMRDAIRWAVMDGTDDPCEKKRRCRPSPLRDAVRAVVGMHPFTTEILAKHVVPLRSVGVWSRYLHAWAKGGYIAPVGMGRLKTMGRPSIAWRFTGVDDNSGYARAPR